MGNIINYKNEFIQIYIIGGKVIAEEGTLRSFLLDPRGASG